MKDWELTSPLKAFIWKNKVGSRNTESTQISTNQLNDNIYMYISQYGNTCHKGIVPSWLSP